VELSGIEPLTPTLPVLIVAYWKGVFKGGDTKLVPFKGCCRCNCRVDFGVVVPPIVAPFASFGQAFASC
jgi:hypothetical protein